MSFLSEKTNEKKNIFFMYALFLLNETFTNGYTIEILNFISIVSILCAIFVIISKNPIVSVLYLIGLFLSISCYLILLGINFVGLSYLLVYVGAVSILFLFILMLINVRISELLSNTSNSIPLAIIITIAFNYPVYQLLPYSMVAINDIFVHLNNKLSDNLYNSYGDIIYNIYNYKINSINSKEILFV